MERLITGIRERLIETEPNVTDRLLGNIERDFEFDDRETLQAGITIKARTLRDRGRNSSESLYGADLATLLDVDLRDYKLRKGLLAQCKFIRDPDLYIQTTYEGQIEENYVISVSQRPLTNKPKPRNFYL